MVDRVGLERVDHVRELHPVPHEEHGHVVPDQVPVALARVELDREAARVADGLWRAALVDDRREARDDGRLRPGRAEEVGAGQVRDVVGRLEEALGGGAAGVDDALGDALAVKLHFFFFLESFFFFNFPGFPRWGVEVSERVGRETGGKEDSK